MSWTFDSTEVTFDSTEYTFDGTEPQVDGPLTPSPTIARAASDTDAIRFSWPADEATITGQVSKAGGAYAAVAGAITQRANDGGQYWYQLAYDAGDRQIGSVRYKFTDGTHTRFVNLALGNVPTAEEISDRIEREGGPLDTALDAIAPLTGSNNVNVVVIDADTEEAIEGAVVTISRTGYQDQGTTNAVGALDSSFTVVDATWTIKVTADGYFGDSHTVAIAADYEHPFELTRRPASVSDEPDVCRLTAKITNASKTPMVGAEVTPELVGDILLVSGGFAINAQDAKTVGSAGTVVFDLLQGAKIKYKIFYNGCVFYREVRVPLTAEANIEVDV